MALSFMAEEEKIFLNSDEFKKMKKQESKARLMAVIHQTMRSGRILPKFSPGHRIQPPKRVEPTPEPEMDSMELEATFEFNAYQVADVAAV